MVCKVAMILSNPMVADVRVEKEARALAGQGYRLRVFAWDREKSPAPSEAEKGFDVERIGVKSTYSRGILQSPGLLAFLLKVLPKMLRFRPRVIHCHDLETLPGGLLLSILTRSRVVFDAHEPNYFADTVGLRALTVNLGMIIERALVRFTDAVIVAHRPQVAKYTRLGVRVIRIVGNYPDSAMLSTATHRYCDGTAVIGRIGTPHPDSGIEESIEALALLGNEFPSVRMLIAGEPRQAYRKRFESGARAARDKLELMPGYHYSELPALYSRIDVAILPHHRTAWFEDITPVKFFESLWFGVPVVVTDVGEMGRIVREEGCGVVIDEVTPEAIASALRPIIKDSSLRRKMGERARKAAVEKYSWEAATKELVTCYKELQ